VCEHNQSNDVPVTTYLCPELHKYLSDTAKKHANTIDEELRDLIVKAAVRAGH
jgi:hypothetical protein